MYTVYWTEESYTDSLAPALVREPQSREFPPSELAQALKFSEELRTRRRGGARISMITMASEDMNNVGQLGVASIIDGKTPDGHDYEWSKAGRAGKMRPKDYVKTANAAE